MEFVPAYLFLAIAFSGIASAGVLWFGWLRAFTLSALATILFLRFGSVEIARTDQDPLKAELGPVKEYQVAMLDESRDIWHELGLLSVSIGSPMKRLFGYDDINNVIKFFFVIN